jgi:UDPglucose 6-dehydrogenase
MRIAVVGTGYVGLVTGTCLAESGNQVICVDIDSTKVARMQNGEIPIYEPHLDVLFHRNIKQGRLSFTTDLAAAVAQSDILFLALPTPPGEDGSADLSYVLGVANDLGHLMDRYRIVIGKSTVPVGTGAKVKAAIAVNAKSEFDVVSNPEFLREGLAVDDFMKPDRIVIGVESEKAKQILTELYAPFVRQGNPILFMDIPSAELTKYAANSFLATKISFMNEVAQLCEKLGANVDMVRLGIGTDERIGKRFLFPGIGYGGSCFPKDVTALVESSRRVGYSFKILESVLEVNAGQREFFLNKILQTEGVDLRGKHVALWGLAFKPDTDDIREAPALYLAEELLRRGATVSAYDPEAMPNVRAVMGDKLTYGESAMETLRGADFLVVATEWGVFRNPDFQEMQTSMRRPVIYDGRNIYDAQKMKTLGFEYSSIGRPENETQKR